MKTVFVFESVGNKHSDEFGFFKFLVRQKFSELDSKVLQWCEFDGLRIVCEALDFEIIDWCKDAVKDGFETNTGYKYVLTKVIE